MGDSFLSSPSLCVTFDPLIRVGSCKIILTLFTFQPRSEYMWCYNLLYVYIQKTLMLSFKLALPQKWKSRSERERKWNTWSPQIFFFFLCILKQSGSDTVHSQTRMLKCYLCWWPWLTLANKIKDILFWWFLFPKCLCIF